MTLVLVVNFGLHHLYHRLMIINRLNNNQDEQFQALGSFNGILLLGNSHNPLNPEIIGDAFNYASPHELFPQTYYKLKTLLETTSVKPQMVIMSVDASAFSPGIEKKMRFHDYWVKYMDYFEMAKHHQDNSYIRYLVNGRCCSYLGNYTYIWQSTLGLFVDLSPMKNGYRPPRNFKCWIDVVDKQKAGWERANSFVSSFSDSHPDSLMLEYFKLIIELCHEHNIQVALFRSPLTKEYLENANKFIDYNIFDGVIDSITDQYPNVTNTFTYRNIFIDSPKLFFNADHVNPIGADSLTRLVRENLIHILPSTR